MKPIPVAFHFLGTPLIVHTYGIGLALTFYFGFRYFERRLQRAGYPSDWLIGVFLWIVVAAIVGARVVHVAANWSAGPDYSAHPGDILKIWNGGLSSFGGLLGGVPTGVLLARRRCPTLDPGRAVDLVAPVLMAAWGVGRLLGPQLMVAGGGHPTGQWFGMYYAGEVGKRLPVPIFQAVESFVIFGVLIWIEHRFVKRPRGFVLAAAMALWGLERFVEQHLWLSGSSGIGSTLVQAAGLGLFAAGVVTMVVLRRRQRHAGHDPSSDDTTGSARPEPVEQPVAGRPASTWT